MLYYFKIGDLLNVYKYKTFVDKCYLITEGAEMGLLTVKPLLILDTNVTQVNESQASY